MRHYGIPASPATRRAVPRGIARSGPAVLSYGFRPFFLLAGLAGLLNMAVWIGALSGRFFIGGPEGPIAWHGHEMLFGYATAALSGFILTAVPNWTGRLPVSGPALLGLVLLWLAGRILMALPATAGSTLAVVLDSLFLPTFALVIAREVIAGRNRQSLRVVAGISGLAALNLAFHLWVGLDWDVAPVLRGTVALYVTLVALIGGRIIPSFTRNYLAKRGASRLPRPRGTLDSLAVGATLFAGIVWVLFPDGAVSATIFAVTAMVNAVRMARWRGLQTVSEPLVLVLHAAYGFVCAGFAGIAAAALGLIAPAAALHVMTVGVIGVSTMAVMTRASRGHTGRRLEASWATSTAYVCLIFAAAVRPAAEMLPELYHPILEISGGAWMLAFSLYLIEYSPILLRPSLGHR